MSNVIVITGTTKGLGKDIALSFLAKKSYKVFGIARGDSTITHKRYVHIKADIGTKDGIHTIKSVLENQKIDILINNAALFANRKFIEMSLDEIQNVLNTNTLGTILMTKVAINNIVENGRIIFINSVAGLEEIENQSIYCASKYALTAFAGVIGKELKDKNIQVTSIHPGGLNTTLWNDSNPYPGNDVNLTIKPDEIINLINFLLNSPSTIRYKTLKLFPNNEWHS